MAPTAWLLIDVWWHSSFTRLGGRHAQKNGSEHHRLQYKTLPCALSSDLGHLLPRLGLVFGRNAGEANFDTSSSVASTPKCSEQITAFHLAQVRWVQVGWDGLWPGKAQWPKQRVAQSSASSVWPSQQRLPKSDLWWKASHLCGPQSDGLRQRPRQHTLSSASPANQVKDQASAWWGNLPIHSFCWGTRQTTQRQNKSSKIINYFNLNVQQTV